MKDYQNFLNETYKKIRNEPEWKSNFSNYLRNIYEFEVKNGKLKEINENEEDHLGIYTSVSNKGDCYDVRYDGQSIASFQDGKFKLKENIEKYFENVPDISCLSENEVLLALEKMQLKKKLHSPEHIFESRVLKLMNKANEKEILRNIKPVCINDLFFQMPTFFASSKHKEISFTVNGGGIDIFARIKVKNENVSRCNHLCIMELKDEYDKNGETPDIIIEQAISYACCIHRLLKSEKGKDWYNFFRDKIDDPKEIPDPLVLYACVVTPCPKNEIIPEEYKIEDEITFPNSKDKLRLRYLYLNMKAKNVEIVDTNLELQE